jgi:hypothetical protein
VTIYLRDLFSHLDGDDLYLPDLLFTIAVLVLGVLIGWGLCAWAS